MDGPIDLDGYRKTRAKRVNGIRSPRWAGNGSSWGSIDPKSEQSMEALMAWSFNNTLPSSKRLG